VQAFRIQVARSRCSRPLRKTSGVASRCSHQRRRDPAGGPYDLWREGEDARRVKDLVGAFAGSPPAEDDESEGDSRHIVNGCVEGVFVARLTRPDKSVRTFWQQRRMTTCWTTPAGTRSAEKAELTEIVPRLLYPQGMKALWTGPEITVKEAHEFFDGQHAIRLTAVATRSDCRTSRCRGHC